MPPPHHSIIILTILSILLSFCSALNQIQLSLITIQPQQFNLSYYYTRQNQTYMRHINDVIVVGSIQVGSQRQTYRVLLDTGSDMLWLTSPSCSNCVDSRKPFQLSTSQTYQTFKNYEQDQLQFELGYGTGYVEGLLGSDIIQLGEISARLDLLSVTEESEFEELTTDGLIGLGRDPLIPNIFTRAYNQGQIVSSMFAFKLYPSNQSQTSYLYYNFTDEQFPGIKFIQCAYGSGSWEFPISKVTINDRQYDISTVVTDTGASTIFFPVKFQQQISNNFLNQYCSPQGFRKDHKRICYSPQKVKYPNLLFHLQDGQLIIIEPQDYLLDMNGKYHLLRIQFTQQFDFVLLGIPFFYHRIVILDSDSDFNPRIGIQLKKRNPNNFLKNKLVLFILQWLLITVVLGTCGLCAKIKPQPVKKDFPDWLKGIFCCK